MLNFLLAKAVKASPNLSLIPTELVYDRHAGRWRVSGCAPSCPHAVLNQATKKFDRETGEDRKGK